MRRWLSILFLLFCAIQVFAQSNYEAYRLTRSCSGQMLRVRLGGYLTLSDDDASTGGNYSTGPDSSGYIYTVVINGDSNHCQGDQHFCLSFSQFDIDPRDTLYIYDGANASAPLLLVANNDTNELLGARANVFVSPANNSNCLTLVFKVSKHAPGYKGFLLQTRCEKPCEVVVPRIADEFYRMRNGVIYDTATVVDVVNSQGNSRLCVNLCYGDQAVLKGNGIYTHYHGYYTPTDSTSTFYWDLGIDRVDPQGPDTAVVVGDTLLRTQVWSDTTGCFDVLLKMVDTFGCASTELSTVRVRVASRPIKTIVDPLGPFCNTDSLLVRIGSDPVTSHLVIDTMHQITVVSRANNIRTFIPDGPNCAVRCYSAPVDFTEFPNRTVLSKDDICSVCINFEHSYMGDYDLAIVCPNNRRATLKYKSAPSGYPAGAGGGAGIFTGYPYGGTNHDLWDGASGQYCDTAFNMYGVGLDYCFSRNADYTLVDGRMANDPVNANHYLANTQYVDAVTVTFPPRPAAYQRSGVRDAGTKSFSTKHHSDYTNKLDYYKPADDFSSLVGCPLNGTWKVEICDNWAVDNGWIFSWWMDLCNIDDSRDCKYDVNIDSIRWEIDTRSSRYDNGRYYGAEMHVSNDSMSYVLTPDTAGYFPITVHVYDDFGCVWDTSTHVFSIWAPKPDLGPRREVCNDQSILLTAVDRHADYSFSYQWQPVEAYSQSVMTERGLEVGSENPYIVTVTNNSQPSIFNCIGSDTVVVHVLPKPLPNFDASTYPLEGCAPLFEQITNHSLYTDHYFWDFGDGTTSTSPNPSHTYQAGTYTLRYLVENDYGCRDSLVLKNGVQVFETPHAEYYWEPAFPTVTRPTITLQNRSVPDAPLRYFWEVQYDKDNPYSFET
ncbi:MAG: PKD domain-containing protein, partial [Bacteroidales bacterium]|nr:PKD domain-containing protein [Candidatus Colimorpha onthohippi]